MAESINNYILLDYYTGMYKTDGKNRAMQQDLPILGKPYRCFNDILSYFSLKDSKGLSLVKSSVDKLWERIERSKRKCSSTLSFPREATKHSTKLEIAFLQVSVEQTAIEQYAEE